MIYNLAGCLQQANSFFLDDCVDDIVSSWTPLIQIFNGDLLSINKDIGNQIGIQSFGAGWNL